MTTLTVGRGTLSYTLAEGTQLTRARSLPVFGMLYLDFSRDLAIKLYLSACWTHATMRTVTGGLRMT